MDAPIFQYAWYVFPIFGSGIASLLLVGVSVYYPDYPGNRSFTVLMLAIAWWSFAKLIELGTTDPTIVILAVKLMYLGIVVVPVAWLLFAIQYTGQIRPPTRKELGGLLLIPALMVVLVWTNHYHGLIWSSVTMGLQESLVILTTEHGPGFGLWTLYAYLLVAVGTGIMLKLALFSGRVYRGQAIGVTLGALFPWVGSIVFVTGISGALDMTSIGFSLSGLLFLTTIYRRQLLQALPAAREIARDEIITSMAEGVIVVDTNDNVTDLNPRTKEIFGIPESNFIGRPFADVFPELQTLRESSTDGLPDTAELTLSTNGKEQIFNVRLKQIHRSYGMVSGELITLNEMTERKKREQRIKSQRQRLTVVNRVLRHDIRNEIQIILGYADILSNSEPDPAQAKKIRQKGEYIMELSEKARHIEQFAGDDSVEITNIDVGAMVKDIVHELKGRYPDAEFHVEGPDMAEVNATKLIDSALKNVLENAVEHNDQSVPKVEVTIETPTDGHGEIVVEVADNGPGIPEHEQAVIDSGTETALSHSSGLGLWIIYWIINQSGGEITFTENTPRGSRVIIRLPTARTEL